MKPEGLNGVISRTRNHPSSLNPFFQCFGWVEVAETGSGPNMANFYGKKTVFNGGTSASGCARASGGRCEGFDPWIHPEISRLRGEHRSP